MSIDPADPRCPACDGPVGATSVYCMHCGADLVDGSSDSVDVTDVDDLQRRGKASGAGGVEDGPLLAPDGVVDDSATAVVGIATGAVVGCIAFLLLGFATASAWSIILGLLAGVAVAVYLARRRTVGDAVAVGGYLVAIAVFVFPTFLLGPAVEGGSLAGTLVLVVLGLVLTGVVGGAIAAVGYGIGDALGRSRE